MKIHPIFIVCLLNPFNSLDTTYKHYSSVTVSIYRELRRARALIPDCLCSQMLRGE